MSFPVLLKTEEGVASDESLYYLVAGNGLFQVRDTPSYRSVTRSEAVLGLLPEHEGLWLRAPRLPSSLLEPVLAFFYDAYRAHGGEAVVILFHQPETGEYRVEVPEQQIPGYYSRDGRWVPYLELQYGQVDRPDGFLRYGTIHSHAHLAAYSSGTDCKDEHYQDGLHVVYGHLDRETPSRSAGFVVNGVRFDVAVEDALEDCAVPAEPGPESWLAKVERSPSSWSSEPSRWLWDVDKVRGESGRGD